MSEQPFYKGLPLSTLACLVNRGVPGLRSEIAREILLHKEVPEDLLEAIREDPLIEDSLREQAEERIAPIKQMFS